MRLYLAGPMRGIPEFNFPAFHAAAARLRAQGHMVFNPAEKDNERHGINFAEGNTAGSIEQARDQHGFSLRVALGEDLDWICEHAEGIALLPGWELSNGARAEWATAVALSLTIIYLNGEQHV